MLVKDEMHASQDETHILHPSSRMLFRFWDSMRAEQPAPHRDQLDLKCVRALVPSLFIAQPDPKNRSFQWRLAGTAVCDLYRRELTGTSMLDGFDAFECDVIRRFLGATMSRQQPAMLKIRMTTDLGQEIGAELAAFPIFAADGVSIHILGGLFPFRDASALGYSAITRKDLVGARLVWTENLPDPVETAPLAGRPRLQVIPGGLAP